MTQEELDELAGECRLAFGYQANAFNDGVDAMLRAVSIAQAQAAEPEIATLRKQLAEQVELVEKCMAAMNSNADAGQAAEAALSALREQIATSKPVGYVIKNPNGSISLTTLSEYERMEDWQRKHYVPAYLREEIGVKRLESTHEDY